MTDLFLRSSTMFLLFGSVSDHQRNSTLLPRHSGPSGFVDPKCLVQWTLLTRRPLGVSHGELINRLMISHVRILLWLRTLYRWILLITLVIDHECVSRTRVVGSTINLSHIFGRRELSPPFNVYISTTPGRIVSSYASLVWWKVHEIDTGSCFKVQMNILMFL